MSSPNLTFTAIVPIPAGQNYVIVQGLNIPFQPTDASGTTESGPDGGPITATPDQSTLSRTGGLFNLSAAPADGSQFLVAVFYGYTSTLIVTPVPSSALFPYSWTPESGQPLSSPALTGLGFEQSLMQNISEFLSGYFTGGTHTILNGQLVMFQQVFLNFQQGFMEQPIEGASIRCVLANSGTAIQTQYGNLWRTKQTVGLEFYVRAALKKPRADGWNRDFLCRNVSDCLYGLLLDRGASIPLQRQGFRRIRPQNPAVISDALYSTRRIRCGMDLWFDSAASYAVDSVLGGDN